MEILNNKTHKLNIILAVFIFSTFTFSTVNANNDYNYELINETNITTNKHRIKPLSSVLFLSTNSALQQTNNLQKTRGSLKNAKLNTRKLSTPNQYSQLNINSLNTRGELAHTSM